MASTQAAPFTAFDYRYRDAGNYKASGSLLLIGRLSTDEREMIIDRLEAGELFLAEQVGIRPLYAALYELTGGPTYDDHCWHEFSGFRDIGGGAQDIPVWGEATSLVAAFEKVSGWDLRLSPHFVI